MTYSGLEAWNDRVIRTTSDSMLCFTIWDPRKYDEPKADTLYETDEPKHNVVILRDQEHAWRIGPRDSAVFTEGLLCYTHAADIINNPSDEFVCRVVAAVGVRYSSSEAMEKGSAQRTSCWGQLSYNSKVRLI